jgi:hypothetical protein
MRFGVDISLGRRCPPRVARCSHSVDSLRSDELQNWRRLHIACATGTHVHTAERPYRVRRVVRVVAVSH